MIADVWANEKLAGWLASEEGTITFSYVDEYVRAGGKPIATTLTGGVVGDSLPPFFAGLLPEGKRLSRLQEFFDEDLALMVAVGGNTVGNVFVLPRGQAPYRVEPLVKELEHFGHPSSASGVSPDYDRHALPGVQDKASALGQIVKFSPQKNPGLVVNESLCLAAYRSMPMAKSTVQNRVVVDSDGITGLLVKRFDGSYPHKFPVEDASQLLGIYPGQKYDVSYEQVCEAVLNVVTAPLESARNLAQQLAFAWLSGNGDLHAKNVSVIDRGRGFEVAPVYDIPSTASYGDSALALPVMDSVQGLSRKRFVAFCEGMDVPEPVAQRIADEPMHSTEGLAVQLISACGFERQRARDVERVLRWRRRHW